MALNPLVVGALVKGAGKALGGLEKAAPALATQAISRMTRAGRAQSRLDKEAYQGLKRKGPTAEDVAFRQGLMQAAAQGQGSVQDRKNAELKRMAAAGGLFTSGLATQQAIGDGSLPQGTLAEIGKAEGMQRANRRKEMAARIDKRADEIRAMLYDRMSSQKESGADERRAAEIAGNLQGMYDLRTGK
jgi:hypothetical protein